MDEMDLAIRELLREFAPLVGGDNAWLVTMVIRTDDGGLYQVPMIPCSDEKTAMIQTVRLAKLYAQYPRKMHEKFFDHHPELLPEVFSVECFRYVPARVTLR